MGGGGGRECKQLIPGVTSVQIAGGRKDTGRGEGAKGDEEGGGGKGVEGDGDERRKEERWVGERR